MEREPGLLLEVRLVPVKPTPRDGAVLTNDRRGEPRPETGYSMCDAGAFEVQP